ncbi:hypothetical protein AAVH_14640 [Aphelenchoides avenae]|nr:hypothetical protein AAVH_14640 [Aphelenchus avenae]
MAPTCPQNESFTVCSTPEGTCESVDPRTGPFGPPKCECVLGFVRHGERCIHHSDCPAFGGIKEAINVSSFAAPEKCPRYLDVYSDNFFGTDQTLKAIIEGRAGMCWRGRPECPKLYYHCVVGANASRTFCCAPRGGGAPFPMAPDVCAAGGSRIRSPIGWYWKVYKILDWILCVLLPIVVLSVLYTLTCRRLWSGDGQLRAAKAAANQGSAVNQNEEPRTASRRGVVRMLIICVVLFYACYTFPSVVYLAE